jgi:hypothetical protein
MAATRTEPLPAGYDNGIHAAENKQFNGADFCNADGMPQWHEIARYCQVNGEKLRESEKVFVNDMAARSMYREPTPKQKKWLRSIFLKLGGKL